MYSSSSRLQPKFFLPLKHSYIPLFWKSQITSFNKSKNSLYLIFNYSYFQYAMLLKVVILVIFHVRVCTHVSAHES